MKLTLKTRKPRNRFVMAAARRSAGTHQTGMRAQRQQAQRALRGEIDRLHRSP